MIDYKKRYTEALDWMRDIYPTITGAMKEDAEHFFPELKQREDEKTRDWLVNHLQRERENYLCATGFVHDQYDKAITFVKEAQIPQTEERYVRPEIHEVEDALALEDPVRYVEGLLDNEFAPHLEGMDNATRLQIIMLGDHLAHKYFYLGYTKGEKQRD